MFGRQKIADLQARLNQIESERSQLQRELQAAQTALAEQQQTSHEESISAEPDFLPLKG